LWRLFYRRSRDNWLWRLWSDLRWRSANLVSTHGHCCTSGSDCREGRRSTTAPGARDRQASASSHDARSGA
ncbi:hypothetical protein ACFOYZ_29490, partial [Neobacillus cucumis]|uniref:hypothetical protein n=1 Tax=Neobacillus cucumis TaxID=1740721 RepID=UPI003615860D